jgi:gluconate 2-dehydrogenase gamma chain
MGTSRNLSRRKFMQIAAAAAAASGAISCGGTRSPWRFLTVEEARTLAAICDQIIPPDQDPGAAWAGVVNYIDRQLTGYFKGLQKTYRQGIAGVDQSSLALGGKRFVDLPAERQIEVLAALEKGQAPGQTWQRLSAKEFFALLVSHTMQGFYGDPRHGGNREGVSWKMLGLPYPPIRGPLRYDLTKPGAQGGS